MAKGLPSLFRKFSISQPHNGPPYPVFDSAPNQTGLHARNPPYPTKHTVPLPECRSGSMPNRNPSIAQEHMPYGNHLRLHPCLQHGPE